MLTEVTKRNNDNFISLEDTFIMNPVSAYLGNPSEPMEVIIKCPHKRKRISALMTGGISISATANWKEVFGGGAMGIVKQGMSTISGNLSWMMGQSVMQPWMNRKMWESTSPFTVTIPLSFVCTAGDAKSEVYDPCMALLSLIYPRQYGVSNNGASGSASSALSAYHNMTEKLSNTFSRIGANGIAGAVDLSQKTDESTVVGSMLNALKLYNIPGPSLNTQDKEQGDPISVMIGPTFNLGSVYLKDVKVDESKSRDPSGYALAAKVTLTVEPANACYCKPDGTLVIFDMWNEEIEDLNNVMDQVTGFVGQLAETTSTLVESFIGTFATVGNLVTGA